MRHLYLDNLSSATMMRRIGSLGVLARSVACYSCENVGHVSRSSPMPAKNNTRGHTKLHKTQSKNKPSGANAESGVEGDAGGKRVFRSQACDSQRRQVLSAGRATLTKKRSRHCCYCARHPQHAFVDDDNKLRFNLNDDLKRGILWMVSTK